MGKSHFFFSFTAALHNYNYEGYMCVHVVASFVFDERSTNRSKKACWLQRSALPIAYEY